ncbi:MAG: fumarate hydratase C-terminal domain-containing protein [Desulfobacterales bacterium]|nr:fumarate hydratase C-terminal domain-containing protein [Desulfobacterales bacterium]
MATKNFTIPLSEDDVRSLNVKDTVYLNGRIFTCRSQFQIRALEQHILPDLDFLTHNVMFHMGGIIKKEEDKWHVKSLLATSSIRFEKLGADIVRKLGLRAVIGKGTMGEETMQVMKAFGCVHLSWGGLMGNILAQRVANVVEVYELETLGQLEATWVLDVENFGPFVVSIDTKGNNLFHLVNEAVMMKLNDAKG